MSSTDYAHLPDDALLNLVKSRDDQTAFREIYGRHWKSILLVAYKKLRSKELAEEVTQNLFISLWEKRAESQIQHLPSYLFGALKFSIINYYKSQMVHEKYVNYVQGKNENCAYTTEELVLLADLSQTIDKGIALLPPKTQRVFKLSRLEHRTVKEIAALLEISEKAVEYHITQSLKLIHSHLKDYVLLLLVGLLQ